MMTMKVEEFIKKLGSTESVPSGGSTVGIISAFAASLALMASNVSVISKKSLVNDSNKPYVDGLISKLESCVERFKFFATQDAVVFEAYMKASKEDKKDKMMDYAEILYQKEFAAGKTGDEFKGFTIVSYCWKALDEYKDEINVTNSLSLFLPLIAVIMIVVAIIVSIRLGLSAIRKLDFDNDATAY